MSDDQPSSWVCRNVYEIKCKRAGLVPIPLREWMRLGQSIHPLKTELADGQKQTT